MAGPSGPTPVKGGFPMNDTPHCLETRGGDAPSARPEDPAVVSGWKIPAIVYLYFTS